MNQIKNFHIARGISEFGNALRQVVLAIVFFQFRNSVKDVQLAELLETAGFILSMLCAPFFIDHFSKKRQLLFCDVCSALMVLLLIYSHQEKILSLALFSAFAIVGFGALHTASLSALAQELGSGVNSQTILGIGRIHLVVLIGALVGLTLGSQLVDLIDVKYFLLIDLLTFMISTVWMLKILEPRDGRSETTQRTGSFLKFLEARIRDWKLAYSLIARDLQSRVLIVASMVNGLVVGIYEASGVAFQKQVLMASNQSLFYVRILNRVLGIVAILLIGRMSKKVDGDLSVRVYSVLKISVVFSAVGLYFVPDLGLGGFYVFNGFYCFSMSAYYLMATVIQSSLINKAHLGKIESLRFLMGYLMVLLGNFLAIPLFSIDAGAFGYKVGSLLLVVLYLWWRYSVSRLANPRVPV